MHPKCLLRYWCFRTLHRREVVLLALRRQPACQPQNYPHSTEEGRTASSQQPKYLDRQHSFLRCRENVQSPKWQPAPRPPALPTALQGESPNLKPDTLEPRVGLSLAAIKETSPGMLPQQLPTGVIPWRSPSSQNLQASLTSDTDKLHRQRYAKLCTTRLFELGCDQRDVL